MNKEIFAQVIFDLPLDGPFDYSVPEEFQSTIKPGMRVKAPLGRAIAVGIITQLSNQTEISPVKPILNLLDQVPVLEEWQIALSADIAGYYGCSTGQAAFMMLPSLLRSGRVLEQQVGKSSTEFKKFEQQYVYEPNGTILPAAVGAAIERTVKAKERVLILVPDIFKLERIKVLLDRHLKAVPIFYQHDVTLKKELEEWQAVRRGEWPIVVGMRSAIFAPIPSLGLIVMTDEGDSSYQQEQTPRYQTRQVALMRAKAQGICVMMTGASPTVEAVHEFKIPLSQAPVKAATVVDTSNYKFLTKGIISPVVLNALEAALKKKQAALVVLNREGLYATTRCIDCGITLECPHCLSPVVFSRVHKHYACRHCSHTLAADTSCSKCHKTNWRSMGIGIERVQTMLQEIFPTIRMAMFSRSTDKLLPQADIVVATQAITRFSGSWQPAVVVLLDLDASLNRMDLNGSYRAWSLTVALKNMAQQQFIVQTRNPHHPVAKALSCGLPPVFYEEELKLRKELGASPFGHWVVVRARAQNLKSVQGFMSEFYKGLQSTIKGATCTEPMADWPAKLRDQHRLRLQVQGSHIYDMLKYIRQAVAGVKNRSRVTFTLDVDA